MIKKIKKIKDFGVYKNFVWPAKLSDFNRQNIIYGWNYSGKTTISRIFSFLENKKIEPKYKHIEFELQLDDNTVINNTNLETFQGIVKVFNSDFIRSNFKWDENNHSIHPIAFDIGGDASKARTDIELNKNKKNRLVKRQAPHRLIVSTFERYESSKFTEEAKRIKNDVMNSVIEFNKGHLKSIVDSFTQNNLDAAILSDDEFQRQKATAIAINDKNHIDEVTYLPSFETLKIEVQEYLAEAPPKTEIIDILENDMDNYRWVETGVGLNTIGTPCLFCGEKFTEERYYKLLNYFNNESNGLRERIELQKRKITQELAALDAINLPKSHNDFIGEHAQSYQEKLKDFDAVKQAYNNSLDALQWALNHKIKESLTVYIQFFFLKKYDEVCEQLTNWINDINEIIANHNTLITNFKENQEAARVKVKRHLVASYLKAEDYFKNKTLSKISKDRIDALDRFIQCLTQKNIELEAKLKSIAKGQEEVNKYIHKFFNRDDINIKVTSDDRFVLKRGNYIAENLSEGEKTAIAFSYFLTQLESLQTDGKLVETTVFIDDPISSLDTNHIAEVYSLIISFFFRKNLNPANPEEVVRCFKQLFISTHNFEFFSFIKSSKKMGKKIKTLDDDGKKKEVSGLSTYFIKRVAPDESCIEQLPKPLRDFKSEYVYLFQCIHDFKNVPDTAVPDILIPNAIRRFLEMYTLSKLPHTKDELDERVNELLGAGHSFKILNHFSHFTSFESLTKHSELMSQLPAAIDELFKLLEKDPTHYDSLKKAVGVST